MGFLLGAAALGAIAFGIFLWRKRSGAAVLSPLDARVPETIRVPVSPATPDAPFRVKTALSTAVGMLALAIAQFETGDRNFSLSAPERWKGKAGRNLNPGNLRGGFQRGATGQDGGGYTIFRSASDGWSALLSDVKAKVTGRSRTGLGPHSTLTDFFRVYAPDTENPTARYTSFVASLVKVGTDVPFRDWIDL